MLQLKNIFKAKKEEKYKAPLKPKIMKSVYPEMKERNTPEAFNAWAQHVHDEAIKARFGEKVCATFHNKQKDV